MECKKSTILIAMCFLVATSLYWLDKPLLEITLDNIGISKNMSRFNFRSEKGNGTQVKNLVLNRESFSSVYLNNHLKFNKTRALQKYDEYHKILWWNQPAWTLVDCKTSWCEFSNCVLTTDKKEFKNSSAVIISIVDSGPSNVPVTPAERNPNQAWIFFSLESPLSYIRNVYGKSEWKNVFNWSMTYHRSADIFVPYGFLQQREIPPNKNYTAIFHKKNKQAAWVVSHCSTHSKREYYIEQLRKHIPVDKYGGCGRRLPDKELYDILRTYKFYLGFENALCNDYFTEKLFSYMEMDLIVVVRGLPDYNKHLPNQTFVNAAHFQSIKSLGQYLVALGNNEKEYIQYLKNIDQFKVVNLEKTYCQGVCTICEKVNNISANRRTYPDALEWAGECESPKDLY